MPTEINLDILDAPTSIMNQDELDGDALAHHGIKGQKWGIRRYQNPDGSLTEAGRKHYSKGIAGRKKAKLENKLLRSTMAKIDAEKGTDDALDDWGKKSHRTIELDNKASALQDKADIAKNKAYEYEKQSGSSNYSSKKANELWKKAGELQDKADKAYDEYSKAMSDEDDAGTKYTQKHDYRKQIDDKHDALANKYIKKYGQQEYDSLPKDKHQITERAIDDYIKAMNGDMSKSEFNRKYRNTGYAIHSDPAQDFLAHHGIKGQKWGIRRYQNPDGSLTTMGRMRYGVGAARKVTGKAAKAAGKAIGKAARKATGLQTEEELDAELKKAQAKYDRAEKKRQIGKLSGRRKPVYKMSDRELDEYVNRLNKEKQAQALRKEIKENGRGFISKFAHNTMDNIADNTARGIGEGLKRGLSGKIDEVITGKGESSSKKAANEAQNQLNRYRDDLEYKALNGDIDALRRLATTKAATGKNAEKVLADLEKKAKEAEAKQKQAEENERRKKEILDRYSKARQEYWSSHLLPPSQ